MTSKPVLSQPKVGLITGVTGQDGSYLAELLLEKGYSVCGLTRDPEKPLSPWLARLQHHPDRRFRLIQGDVSDRQLFSQVLENERPDEIYHLAAQSHVHDSFEKPLATLEINAVGTLHLLEAVRNSPHPHRVMLASSSEIFGNATGAQTESSPLHARNPYGASKMYAHQLTNIYRQVYHLFAASGILFNHESPRRSESFVTRKVTRGIGRIVAGLQSEIVLGNLDVQKDWGFAGDYVAGMWKMLQQKEPEDFVLATGKLHSIREFVECAFKLAKIPIHWEGLGVDERGVTAEGRVVVRIDSRFFRPEPAVALCGDASHAAERLGWQPRTSFDDLVQMMVTHDIELAQREAQRLT